jgi:hypothetical protein
LRRCAWSPVSMPSVAQVSMPSALTPSTSAVEVAILGRAPGRAHAETRGAGGLGGARLGQHGFRPHQLFGLHAGIVVGRLRAIGAVLRATAGLNRQQCRNLHFERIEMQAVDALRLGHQLGKGQREQRPHLRPCPVVADLAEAGVGGR